MVGVGVAVSLTMILTTCQFRFLSGDVALIDSPVGWLLCPFLVAGGWLVGMFSMESLILAQDERWRRA